MHVSKRWLIEGGICLAIIGVLAAIAIPNYHEGQVRPRNRYVFSCFSEFYHTVNDAYAANPTIELPTQLPTNIEHPERAEGTAYADPFDRTKRAGAKRICCQVHPVGGSGDPVDFNFWGNPYKWHRLSVHRGLIYSYGPDEDDDLAALSTSAWSHLTTSTVQVTLQPYTYDSTNGTISNGDCWRFIDLDDRF
jgi:hypothetical protein